MCHVVIIIVILAVNLVFAGSLFATSVVADAAAKSPVITCNKALESYLEEKLGKMALKDNKIKLTKELFDRCSEFAKQKPIAISESVESGEEVAIPADAEIEPSLVDNKLKELGFLVDGDYSVIVFASERIDKNWIGSFFTSFDKSSKVVPNECEVIVGDHLIKKGFQGMPRRLNSGQRVRARKFKTVVGRYKDLSSMPNFTSVRAASIINETASAVVGCRVYVKVDENKGADTEYSACAKAQCKAVDMDSLKGIATAASYDCTDNTDRTTASISAIRNTCGEMGRSLSASLVRHYSSGGGRDK